MRDRELFFQRQLGKGFTEGRIVKVGVVTEAARATRRIENDPVRAPLDHGLDPSTVRQRNYTYIMRIASRRRLPSRLDMAEGRQQFRVVGCVRSFGSGIAGGVDSRRSPQRVDRDAGIIREDPAFYIGAVMEGLLAGILLKGRAILHARRQASNPGHRLDNNLQFTRSLAEFTDLPRIGGRKV